MVGTRLVVLARGDQRRHLDLVQAVDHAPVLERADDCELARPVHVAVDLVTRVSVRALDALRPAIEAADVAFVELEHRGRVFGARGHPARLVVADRLLRLRR